MKKLANLGEGDRINRNLSKITILGGGIRISPFSLFLLYHKKNEFQQFWHNWQFFLHNMQIPWLKKHIFCPKRTLLTQIRQNFYHPSPLDTFPAAEGVEDISNAYRTPDLVETPH